MSASAHASGRLIEQIVDSTAVLVALGSIGGNEGESAVGTTRMMSCIIDAEATGLMTGVGRILDTVAAGSTSTDEESLARSAWYGAIPKAIKAAAVPTITNPNRILDDESLASFCTGFCSTSSSSGSSRISGQSLSVPSASRRYSFPLSRK